MIASHLSYFKIICRFCRSLKSIVITWEKPKNGLSLVKGFTKGNILWKIHFSTYTLFAILVAAQSELFRENSGVTFNQLLISKFGIICHFVFQIFILICYHNASFICAYVNGLLQFEQKNSLQLNKVKRQNKKNVLEVLNLAFTYGYIGTISILPVAFVYGLHWFNPCSPSLAGYKVLKECGNRGEMPILKETGELLLKIVVFLVNHWFWAFGSSICLFLLSGILILCSFSFREYIQFFQYICMARQTNRMFYELHTAMIYRSIQYLAGLMNEIQQYILLIVIVGLIFGQSSSTALMIILSTGTGNSFNVLIFLVIMMECIAATMVVFGGMSITFLESQKCFQELQQDLVERYKMKYNRERKLSALEFKWRKRFYKSCGLITFRFGSLNFVDQRTPLNCVDFANGMTVQLLLLGRN